jgi:hypothetical protein
VVFISFSPFIGSSLTIFSGKWNFIVGMDMLNPTAHLWSLMACQPYMMNARLWMRDEEKRGDCIRGLGVGNLWKVCWLGDQDICVHKTDTVD